MPSSQSSSSPDLLTDAIGEVDAAPAAPLPAASRREPEDFENTILSPLLALPEPAAWASDGGIPGIDGVPADLTASDPSVVMSGRMACSKHPNSEGCSASSAAKSFLTWYLSVGAM